MALSLSVLFEVFILVLAVTIGVLSYNYGHTVHVQPTIPPNSSCQQVEIPSTNPKQLQCLHIFKSTAPKKKGSIVWFHGFAEYFRRYDPSIAYFNEQGFDVFGVDLRGHGHSSGVRGILDEGKSFKDFTAHFKVINEALKGDSTPVFVFGHSISGLLTSRYAQKLGFSTHLSNFAGLMTSGAALEIDPSVATPLLQTVTKLVGGWLPAIVVQKLGADTVSRDPQVRKSYATDPLIIRGVIAETAKNVLSSLLQLEEHPEVFEKEFTVPSLLIMHGTKDIVAPPSASQWLYDHATNVQDKELKFFDGLYHELLNEPEQQEVREHMLSWMLKRL